ncbi:MAG: helix-turn-helix transcriptional regulator [Bacilli bacterium]|jgi:transcriptional regulator with XRE-family HTH domain|nr:helix-turn-helix transcriptional regulator [Bacilli bacterium]MCX4254107.1 helix-turn-helix transcriptional regulator [Bacilli bacterium]
MEFKANNFKPNETLKFIRQSTGKTQKEFADSIKKSKDWQFSNENGRTTFYFKDLIEIANKYNLDIIIKERK